MIREQAVSALEHANRDFNGLGSDWNTIDAQFDGIKSTLPIKLCLASLDENGNPTDGMDYIEHDGCGRSLPFNTYHWDNTMYMEIYVVRDVECNGKTNNSGYAHYPGNGGTGGERIVFNHRYIGAAGIGTSVSDEEFMSVFFS